MYVTRLSYVVGKACPKSSSFSKPGGPSSDGGGRIDIEIGLMRREVAILLDIRQEARALSLPKVTLCAWWGSAISVAAMKVESAGAAARVKVAKVSKVAARNSSPRTLTATMKESNYAPMLHM